MTDFRAAIVSVLLALLPVGFAAEAARRTAFVTSVSGTGNLGAWADAGGHNGLAAADAICQARAAAAGLSGPGDYVAWISDSSTDAYCRAHGYPGTKAGNCGGLPSLPDDAGPWIRTDGYPFAPTIGDALGPGGVIYAPVRLDEFGNPSARPLVFTGTTASGEYAGYASAACADWTSSVQDQVGAGDVVGGTVAWTQSGASYCNATLALLCLQIGAGDPLPPHWRQGAVVFLTSVAGTGNLGGWPDAASNTGIAAGNAICQERATAAGLPEPTSFRAWLSDATHDAIDQLVLDGPWTRIDGVPVASTLADLTDGELLAPINVDDTGSYVGNLGVWTGTLETGLGGADHCMGWTDGGSSSDGVRGSAYRANAWWTAFGGPGECSFGYGRLYCISNVVANILIDGFESADTAAWSTTVP